VERQDAPASGLDQAWRRTAEGPGGLLAPAGHADKHGSGNWCADGGADDEQQDNYHVDLLAVLPPLCLPPMRKDYERR
jgi:hypothetical protein